MEILLTPELEEAVKAKVASGEYPSASDYVCEALRQSFLNEAQSEYLTREAAHGFAQLEAGKTVNISSKSEFLKLARGES